jgi:hypothetical protein
MFLKFGVKRAPESCQNLGQKVELELNETGAAALPGCAGRHCRGDLAGTAGVRTAALPAVSKTAEGIGQEPCACGAAAWRLS